MEKLNYPIYNFRTKIINNKRYIFDEVRRDFFLLTDEELEMDEKTDVDYLEDGFSILGDVLQGEFDSMFDSLRSFEASTSLNKLKLQSIQICDEALWSYINGYEYYEDSDDYYKDETVAEDPEQSEEAVTEDENYVLDNTATLVQGLSAGMANKINKEFTQVIIQTSEGEIKLELNNKKAPITVENFKKYCEIWIL